MTPEESHVILAARNVYNAGRGGMRVRMKTALADLADACAKLELSERIARNTPGGVVRRLRLIK